MAGGSWTTWVLRRRVVVLVSGLVLLGCFWWLEIGWGDLVPKDRGRALAGEFFSKALAPAMDFEGEGLVREGTFLGKVAGTLWLTFRFALVAVSLALVVGFFGALLATKGWWGRARWQFRLLRAAVRGLATFLRSIHELLWALLFLAALGTTPAAAITALALPYLGTFTKIFSEILDEAPGSAARVTAAGGATGLVTALVLVWQALPDLWSYALYRLECAVRSSAVLGFVGVPTTGYEIATAFEDGHYREIWTHLYALLGLVLVLEVLGARVRQKLTEGVTGGAFLEGASLLERWKKRGKSGFLRVVGWGGVGLTAWCWLQPFEFGSSLSWKRRVTNLGRFVEDLAPAPLRDGGGWGDVMDWAGQLLAESGWEAIGRTLALGTAAALLAGGIALGVMPWASRQLPSSQPWQTVVGGRPWRKVAARGLQGGSMVGRALPEFLLAFLLLQLFGPTVWPLILALVIHNGGILVRLGAEITDNVPRVVPQVTLSAGSGRLVTFLGGVLPQIFNRLLLFLFYRWETCLREATVLGVLGVASMGALIAESRARLRYDELLFWMLMGAGLVVMADLVSEAVRRRLR